MNPEHEQKVREVIGLAISLMGEWGLDGWRVRVSESTGRIGCCDYARKEIRLSAQHTVVNGIGVMRNTILHEIAHALLAGQNVEAHGREWKAMAVKVGANPIRCSSAAAIPLRWTLRCEICGHTLRVSTKPHGACHCMRCFDSGTLRSPRMVVERNPQYPYFTEAEYRTFFYGPIEVRREKVAANEVER